MLIADAVALFAAARAKRVAGRVATLAGTVFVALVLCALSRQGAFGQMRLMACALFIHGVILAAGMALIAGRSRWRAATAWSILALLLAAVGIDAFYIEPYWLDVTHLTLRSAKLDRPLRVVALADFQTDTIGAFERDVLRRVAAEKPDLILLVGDYLQVAPAQWDARAAEFRSLLRETALAPPLGIFAVQGNIDPPEWGELFLDSDVRLFLQTETVAVDQLQLTGLSQPDSMSITKRVAATEPFHIAFGHHPDYALSDEVHADLLIAGHTHGGQVRLPLIGPLLTLSRVPRAWAAGVTRRGEDSTLVVARGTGLERGNAPRLRFLCRPELVVIDLEPAE